jgi:hypothetical protein
VQWGDVPTWIGAVATVGALAGAAVAAGIAYRLYRIESTRDQEAANERRRAQATRISGWHGLTTYREDLPGPKSRQFWKATVRNASDLPVYDGRVEFRKTATQDGAPPVGAVPSHKDIRVLPPGTEQLDGPDGDSDYSVALRYRDAAGVVWYRDAQGFLTEVENRHQGSRP